MGHQPTTYHCNANSVRDNKNRSGCVHKTTVIEIKKSGSELKTYVWLPRELLRLYLGALREESCPPDTRLGTQSVHGKSWRQLQSRIQDVFFIFHVTIPSQVSSVLGLFIWILAWGFQASLLRSPYWVEGEGEVRMGSLKTLFPNWLSTLYFNFSIPSPSPCLHNPILRSIKLLKPFVWGSFNSEMTPQACTDLPHLQPWGKWNRGS